MLSKLWKKPDDTLEAVGFVGVAVAVGFLAGLWWGVLVASVLCVVVAQTVKPKPPAAPEGDE